MKLVARSEKGAGTILYILRPTDIFGELLLSEEHRAFTAVSGTSRNASGGYTPLTYRLTNNHFRASFHKRSPPTRLSYGQKERGGQGIEILSLPMRRSTGQEMRDGGFRRSRKGRKGNGNPIGSKEGVP